MDPARRILCLHAMVVALALLLSAALAQAAAPAPLARNGTLDLSQWDFERDGTAALDGQWEFYWRRWVEPGAAPAGAKSYMQVPGDWNSGFGGGKGFASYRLTIQCSGARELALALPLQHSAMAFYVNGRLVVQQGRPATTKADYEPGMPGPAVALGNVACPMQIDAKVANFDLFRGGLVRSMQLGTSQQLVQRREQALTRNLLALGGVLVLGVLSLTFFFWRRQDRTPLFFGLFCLSFGISLGLSGERALQAYLMPLGFEGHLKLLFMNWFAGLALFPLFLRCLYPRDISQRAIGSILVFSGAGFLVAMLTPLSVFSYLAVPLQAGSAAVALYMAWTLVRARMRGNKSAGILLVGLAVLVIAVAHDVVFFRHLLATSLLPYGMFGFVLAPAVLLAQRFARALVAEELRSIEQRERADLLVRSTKAGVLDWYAALAEVRYSERYVEMLGYTGAPEMPAFRELVHPQDEEKVHASFMAQLRDSSVRSGVRVGEPMDYRMVRRDGATIWVHAEAISICGADGRTLRYICSLIDITERKAMEEELKNRIQEDVATQRALALERDRLRLLVSSTKAGFGDWDAASDTVTYSDRFKEMLGWPAAADTYAWPSIFEMMHPDDSERSRAEFREMIRRTAGPGESEPGKPMSYRLRRRDGSYLWIHAEGISQRDENGRTKRFITSYLDVTAFREQEEALRRSANEIATEQKRLELVVRGARVGIVDWDGHTHETYYSPRFREIRGYAPDADTSGWPDYFKVMIHPDDRDRVIRRWVPFIKGKGPEGPRGEYYSPEEYRLLRADGSHVWVQVSGMAVRDENAFVVRWIAAIIDISERRAQQEALRASHDQVAAQAAELEMRNEALKENVRLREEVERISRHDIKTPLNSIVAVPRLLREERKLGPEADELLGIVERAGYRILSMVNLSLDLYKMEQGSYIFRPDAVDLRDLVQKVLDDVKMHAASKQVEVRVKVEEVGYAWAEELLCYSLLANLLKNAVEASLEGGVVTVTAQAGAAETVLLRIHNGGQVPAAVQPNFFQKYATQGKASGTGLGTYSARLMARVQDGDISMETSQAQGTTLSVTLRAAPPGAMPATARHAAERELLEPLQVSSLPPTRVLLVDDDEYNLLIVRRFLPSPPFTVDIAINGKVALSAAELQWPDLIFMDLDMPVMGGLQAVQELRAMERATLAPRCTMIALSSHDDEETRQSALKAGFDRYLTKPVTRDIIHEVLLEQKQRIGTAAAVVAPVRPLAAVGDPVIADADVEPVLADFMESRRRLLDALAAAAGDRGEVRRIAHQLAGSFGLYGFHWASEQSRWIERNFSEVDAARLGEIAGELRKHLDTVEIRFSPAEA